MLSHVAYLGLRIVGPLFLPHLDEISPLKAIGGIPEDVPVLILASGADRLAFPAEARLYRRVQTQGTLVLFPTAGHASLPLSAPNLFWRTILDFCREIARSPGAHSSKVATKQSEAAFSSDCDRPGLYFET